MVCKSVTTVWCDLRWSLCRAGAPARRPRRHAVNCVMGRRRHHLARHARAVGGGRIHFARAAWTRDHFRRVSLWRFRKRITGGYAKSAARSGQRLVLLRNQSGWARTGATVRRTPDRFCFPQRSRPRLFARRLRRCARSTWSLADAGSAAAISRCAAWLNAAEPLTRLG